MAGPAASSGQLLVLTVLEAVNPELALMCQVGEEEHMGRVGVVSHCSSWVYCCKGTTTNDGVLSTYPTLVLTSLSEGSKVI